VCRADNLTTFMCRLSWNLGSSTSWNPQGLSRPVMGLLYLYLALPSSSVAPLSKKDKHLPSCSPPSIPILRYLSPINNSHLYSVFLYINFPSSFGSTLRSFFLKRHVAQTVHTVCTRINYRIVFVTNFSKYLQYGTSATE